MIIFAIVATGVTAASLAGYHASSKIFTEYTEHITLLASDAVSSRIQSTFIKPISISRTMANDRLLTTLLKEEADIL